MMIVMRKKLAFISLLVSALYAFPSRAIAQQKAINCDETNFPVLCKMTKISEFGNVLGKLITFAFFGAILIALAFLIYGGIKWVTSGGDKTGVEEARNHVVAAIVGLVIIFLSYLIINLVVYLFTGQSLMDVKIPTLLTP